MRARQLGENGRVCFRDDENVDYRTRWGRTVVWLGVCLCGMRGLWLVCIDLRGLVHWVGQRKVCVWVARYRLGRG